MPRAEKPINPNRGEVARFAAALRALRDGAGTPTYRELAARTGYSVTQLSQAAAGRRVPTWQVTQAFVESCGGDVTAWQRDWERVKRAHEATAGTNDSSIYSHAAALLGSVPPPREHLNADAVVAFVDNTLSPAALDAAASHLAHCAQCSGDVAAERIRRSEKRSSITVFLVDDHEIVRRGVADLLEDEPDIEVVGEAATVAAALAAIPLLKPTVAVLDVRMPDGNGVELCRELRASMPDLSCLMLTSYADDEALLNAIMGGAAGFVLKQVLGNDLINAVRLIASGQSLLSVDTTSELMRRMRRTVDHGPLADLTDQERAVFDLVGEGLTNREISARLFLGEKTVKNYVSHILAKLGMQRRTQAAVLAMELKSRPQR
jgi:DNA-binding NarL/FixJ family response regulator